MTSNELRSSFLEYFRGLGHRVVPSSPLVPGDDPTLLFTNAGMNQFKDLFLGREKREYTRAATSQRVMRVSGKHNDLDNVGPSFRHHTFFEMLGNFSFGDYFKEDAIRFAWNLLTDVWKMPKDRLIVSIFKGENGIPRDDEAYDIWRAFVPSERILELGTDDNFWQMGDTGPCGRCSEIYYVRGTGADPEIEIWNNVFMEFDRSSNGVLTPLPAPSIDTGMGLERLTAVLQRKDSNYDTDVFTPLLTRVGELTGVRYGADPRSDTSMRVVADHIRATTFLICDGVAPSNEWRGYVLRKIMRRAMRHGKHLGLTDPFLSTLVPALVEQMGAAYPELRAGQDLIEKTILAEEHRFEAVLTEGLPRLEAEIARVLQGNGAVLAGDTAFQLYDTFGVPYDFIEDTAATHNVTVDTKAFDRAMEAQRGKAREHSAFAAKERELVFMMPSGIDQELFDAAPTHFVGYESTEAEGPLLLSWNNEGSVAERLSEGETGYMALARTPFYAESGGQVDDSGRIVASASGAAAVVEKMVRRDKTVPRVHKVRVTEGEFHRRDTVTAEVDVELRDATRRNHTATHLLHAALRQVLGPHVKQRGSLVAPDRLRFDFAHFQPVTADELERIERIVNEQIVRNTPVHTAVRSTDEAIKAGAMALFGEKYGDKVRVVSISDFSMELCGGTHVRSTGDIGLFTIVAEGGVAAGVRRVDALTGLGALTWAQQQRTALRRLVNALQVNDDQAVESIERLQSDIKRLTRDVTQLKTRIAMGGQSTGETGASKGAQDADTVDVAGIRLLRRKVMDLDKEALRSVVDSLKGALGSGVVLVACVHEGKVQLVVAVTPDLTSRLKAGQIVKELAPLVGGGGGGRPDFAEAGGKHPERVDEMLAASVAIIARLAG